MSSAYFQDAWPRRGAGGRHNSGTSTSMVRRGIARFSAVAMMCCLRSGTAQYDNCANGTVADIGNGLCDAANNNPSCGYDGGDCCPCTCADSPAHACADSDFDCIFPECDDPTAASPEDLSPACIEDSIGNGFCDFENNNASCDYDGGDCCGCTCDHDGSAAVCGFFGFDCRDPASFDPTVVAQYPDCSTGGWLTIGDGICQAENNNMSCGYDGGDCCLCSCSGSACVISGFRCSDPDADDDLYECKPPPPAALPCSAEVQRTWVVDDSAQAQALAAAVNCSGGSFEAEWRGSVVVDGPIYVADGTILTVTGVGSNALMDGNASTRLFTVVNATLHVSGVTIGYGSSPVGGAIAAAGSSLTFNQTDFIGNRAEGSGGAIYVSDGSSVSCAGGTFVYNIAGFDGGAMYVTGSSVVSCGGSWFSNVAGDSGGALMIADFSSVSWSDDTAFAFNTAERFGGAVYALFGSSVSWNASATLFYFNSAWFLGGAMFVTQGSSVSWTGATTFDSNSARSNDGSGGALAVSSASDASWSGITTYMNNIVGANGGGLYIEGGSNASWDEGVTTFMDNFAPGNGGGVAVSGSSHVSCTGATTSTFSGNSATNGGAITVETYSSISFRGNSSFDRNRANETAVNGTGFGGAIFVLQNATATWYGSLTITGNTAVRGGALFVEDSAVSWSGAGMMALNNASQEGGAIYARSSSVAWFAETIFLDNLAGERGGALLAVFANVSWSGETDMLNNAAGDTGGALYALLSSVSWIGETRMLNNSGGALFLATSTVSWKGNTTFAQNIVENGPGGAALTAFEGARVFWGEGYTKFVENYARFVGGALYVRDGSEITWAGDTEFVGNVAEVFGGGAVYIFNGANVSWTGDTRFTANEALTSDGGAIATTILASENTADSNLIINGTTTFSNNAAGANGGGLALLGVCTLTINPAVDVSFVGNTATAAGGAIFLSGTSAGPALTDVSFVSNSAETGGAVSTFASGTKQPGNSPTTFDRCRFTDNRAKTTGGAINSAAGNDAIFSSVFEGNSARTGGALRLAGTASVYDCSFVENNSDEGEGAAVSNIGSMESLSDIYFDGNRFNCPSDMYLDYSAFGDPFETACHGCETTCNGCVFAEGLLAPVCTGVLDHSTSNGGNVTLQTLSIKKGFWRATASSEEVLTCYNADACLGGVTGTSGYCLDGYEGPYCSVCSDGYSAQLSFSCRKCSENSAGGIVLAVVLGIGAFFVGVAAVSYVISGETGLGARQGLVERVTRYIPLQSAKILIVAWQILTQFSSVANVIYPGVYQDFLDGLDVFNFDLSWVLSAGCVVDIDFHDRLLVSTITPIVALLFLACTYAAAVRINRGKPESLKIVQNKHVSMVLLLTFLVYSSVSSTLFKAFACEELDDDKYYLRSDYRIECDSSKHRGFQAYAAVMIALYTVGIPVFYSGLLFKDRDVLKIEEATRGEDPPRVTATSSLWKPYTPKVFYYEVIECARRILLAGVVVFIYPNTAAQIAVTLMIAFAFVVMSEGLAPYTSPWDTWISRMGHVVVFVSMYVALLLKVDVSDERVGNQKVFEAVLVAVHACMILAVVVETVVASCSLKARPQENPSPRLHGGKSLSHIGSKGKRRNTFGYTSRVQNDDLDTAS